MSTDAVRWAYTQKTGSSSRKAVLVSMADRAGEDHTCYPSISRLADDTELNRKTVIKVIDELEELGFIRFTGKTRGNGAKVYQLIGVNGRESSTNFGTSTKNGTSTNFGTATSTNFSTPSTNFGTATSTNFGTQTINEPSIEPSLNHQGVHTHDENTHQNFENPKSDKPTGKPAKKFITADELVALGVDEQVANDYLAIRKTKLTQTALNGIARQAELAGLSLARAVEFACEMGWQSFKADWYANSQKSHFGQGQPIQPNDFEEAKRQWGNNWYGNNQPPIHQPKQIGVSHE